MSTQKIKLGADWAWGRVHARRLRAAGYSLAARYLSYDKTKNLTRPEASELLKAGEDIVVVWESTAGRATQGSTAGRDDALEAVRQLRALRGPKGMAVYFAVDKDVAGVEVAAYFRAARRVVHAAGYRIGAYGSYRVVEYLKGTVRVVDVAWQTVAWSFGKLSKLADLYQRAGYKKVDGVSVDVDVVCHPDYGGWQGALPKTSPHRRAHEKKTPAPPVIRPAQPQKIVDLLTFLLARKKTIVAAVFGIATWGTAALADGKITQTEWLALFLAAAGVGGVHQVKNQQKPPAKR